MKDLNEIRKFIQTRRSTEDLVLCTLVRKSGSSYRGIGAKKIVSLNGEALGFLSGGCLEASIEKTARERIHELPFIASFSTLADEDRLLGYQTGCQGVIDILFEKVNAPDLDLQLPYGPDSKFDFVQVGLAGAALGKRSPARETANDPDFIFEKWHQPVHVYVVGCGADADDYGPLAANMGWTVTFMDYRGSLMTEGRFAPHQAQTVAVNEIGSHIPDGDRIAVILMTHNYEADLEILRSLKNHRVGYLGCLGPAARFDRLRDDLRKLHGEELGADLIRVAHAPAGLYTHGQSPEEIAMSVAAQIQGDLVEKPKEKTWTLILAAGASSRFGGVKALAHFEGRTMLERALSTARDFSGRNVLVVTGAHELPVPIEVMSRNPDWKLGMGRSIAWGVARILERDPKAGRIAVLPVDQPRVSAELLRELARLSRLTGRCALTAGDDGVMGPPAVLAPAFYNRALELNGENGLKSVLRAHEVVCAADPCGATLDIDCR